MHITELTLHTPKLDEQRAFYEQVLDLPQLESTTDSFTIQTGETRFTFRRTEQPGITYHYAFTLSRNKLTRSKEWLRAHGVALLTEEGRDEFPFKSWHADSIYFHDASNNIAEFIVHHDLPNDTPGSFSPRDLVRVSEIGLVVDDVPAQVTQLHERFGIESYKGSPSNVFTAMGDIYGLFIVVKTGRPWRPTTNEQAVVAPVHAVIQGSRAQSYHAASFPYTIDVVVPSHAQRE